MIEWVHPGLLFIFGALFIPLLKGRVREIFLILVPVLAIVSVAVMVPGTYGKVSFAGREIILGQVDKLSIVFGLIFTIMSLIGMIYGFHVKKPGEHVAAFLYVGAALGVVFAGDYFSLFMFWESMAFSSAYLVFARNRKASTRAGFRYLLVHVTGGLFLMSGIVLHYLSTGSFLFGPLPQDGSLAFYLIMVGFILNAAVPPLSAWLTDTYPEATVTGAVFMCAFTTKTAIYVLIRAFPGTELLVWLGVVMAIYGVVYAVMENDVRRLLAYHIISQVGYMVTGIGIGTEMSLNGSTSHAFAHILYKSLLFMGAGSVIYMTGRSKLTELGGLYRTMPITVFLYMIGAFAISAFPLFSGFVTKSMIIAAAAGDGRATVSLLLTLASSGTFLHTGLKLPYYMFFGKDSGLRPKEPPKNMLIAMSIAAFLSVAIGVYPEALYGLLPYAVTFHPYAGAHVVGSLAILMFTLLGFVWFKKDLDPEDTISLDTDWFYRKPAKMFMKMVKGPVAAYEGVVAELSNTVVLRSLFATAKAGLWTDLNIVDAAVNGVANTCMKWGASLRKLQTGTLTHYAYAIIVGIVASVVVYSLKAL